MKGEDDQRVIFCKNQSDKDVYHLTHLKRTCLRAKRIGTRRIGGE